MVLVDWKLLWCSFQNNKGLCLKASGLSLPLRIRKVLSCRTSATSTACFLWRVAEDTVAALIERECKYGSIVRNVVEEASENVCDCCSGEFH